MSIPNLNKVLKEARKLTRQAQTKLAETLLREIGSRVIVSSRKGYQKRPLRTLLGLSIGELEALSNAILAPSLQSRLNFLLRRNKIHALSPKERKELDKLLEECDRIALIKAKANYTLSLTNKITHPSRAFPPRSPQGDEAPLRGGVTGFAS